MVLVIFVIRGWRVSCSDLLEERKAVFTGTGDDY